MSRDGTDEFTIWSTLARSIVDGNRQSQPGKGQRQVDVLIAYMREAHHRGWPWRPAYEEIFAMARDHLPRLPDLDELAQLIERDPSVPPTVSREKAQAIAERAIIARGLGTAVAKTVAYEELRSPLNIYAPRGNAWNCWIAYAERELTGLRSSSVVLVDRDSGAVVYVGSAHDEG